MGTKAFTHTSIENTLSNSELQAQLSAARQNNHRLPVIVFESAQLVQQLPKTLHCTTPIWLISDRSDWEQQLSGSWQQCSWKQAPKLLGQTIHGLILDVSNDIPADALGQVTGALKGGGLLVLICPKERQYAEASPFLKRAMHLMSDLIVWSPDTKAQPVHIGADNTQGFDTEDLAPHTIFANQDQQLTVEAIQRVHTGHRRRPLVLTADRGRGKSAALGIAAAQLMLAAEEGIRIIATGPSLKAANTLFEHAQRLAPAEAHCKKGHITFSSNSGSGIKKSELLFMAPDELAQNPQQAGLVLVDEAATLPAPLLTRLLKQQSRIVFASTIHGYEGTGRGFAIRFRKTLDTVTPKWRQFTLELPIRWSAEDPLESRLNNLLLLDAEPASSDELSRELNVPTDHSRYKYQCLTGQQLSQKPDLLRQLFGLLVHAHYQTSPDDLRQLLDRTDLTISLVTDSTTKGPVILATALVSHEGGFDKKLAEQIWLGKRRPKGHLLPQTLATHAGHKQAALLRFARVMRIAVHPDLQQQGLGKSLIKTLSETCKQAGFDCLGSSFGATEDLLAFWSTVQMTPVHMGSTRNNASGCHSVVVCHPLSPTGEVFYQQARTRFQKALPHHAAHSLKNLEADILLALMQYHADDKILQTAPTLPTLMSRETEVLHAFADGYLRSDTCLPELTTMAKHLLPRFSHLLCKQERQLLVSLLLQCHNWTDVVQRCQYQGKKMAEQALRLSTKTLQRAQG